MNYHPDDKMTSLFRTLTPEEESAFAEHARLTDPNMDQWELFHPACRKVWRERGFAPQKKKKAFLVTVEQTIVREVEFEVEAETADEAKANWQTGVELGSDDEVHASSVVSVATLEIPS